MFSHGVLDTKRLTLTALIDHLNYEYVIFSLFIFSIDPCITHGAAVGVKMPFSDSPIKSYYFY